MTYYNEYVRIENFLKSEAICLHQEMVRLYLEAICGSYKQSKKARKQLDIFFKGSEQKIYTSPPIKLPY